MELETGDVVGGQSSLNDDQRRAVAHQGGPLLILAGAGTGKTRTLVARLAHLLDRGTDPERLLLVTFSRKAAGEMIRRAGELIDPAVTRRVHAGTFHAMAHRVLRQHGSSLGLPSGFTVIDQSDAADLMNLVRNDQGHGKQRRFPRKDTLLSIYSRVVNAQSPLDEVLTRWFPWCAADADGIAAVFSSYTERKRAQDTLDYDDLLLFWQAAANDPATRPVLAAMYDHVLVDEYQDTNVVQANILRGLCSGTAGITVVGDDAQSVYSFRAATVRNILDFEQHFAGATTIVLDRNYRSTQPILDLANTVIEQAGEGYTKVLWSAESGDAKPVLATCPDERAQVDAVCDTVLAHLEDGIRLRDQAVLFRAAHHSAALELELRRRNLPFVKYGGLKFLEAAHVRDLVALLRILDNPYDELAWFRTLQLIEGVGAATARRIMAAAGVRPRSETGRSPIDTVDTVSVPRPAAAGVERLAAALRECARNEMAAGAQIERLTRAIEPMVRRNYDNADARLRDLDQLARLAGDQVSRSRLVADLTFDPPASTGDFAGPPHLDDDYLVLSTVHSAKGGEWRAVHVIHAADGMFPSDMATGDADSIDEERRLFYVALTRAREHLHIYAPLAYHHTGAHGMGDAHSYAQRSRFLPPSVDNLLDHRAVRSPHADAVGNAPQLPPLSMSVDDVLKSLW